jgi:hypothetical protein
MTLFVTLVFTFWTQIRAQTAYRSVTVYVGTGCTGSVMYQERIELNGSEATNCVGTSCAKIDVGSSVYKFPIATSYQSVCTNTMDLLFYGFTSNYVKRTLYPDKSCGTTSKGIKGYGSSYCWMASNSLSYSYVCNGTIGNYNTYSNGNCQGSATSTDLILPGQCFSNSTFSCVSFSTNTMSDTASTSTPTPNFTETPKPNSSSVNNILYFFSFFIIIVNLFLL